MTRKADGLGHAGLLASTVVHNELGIIMPTAAGNARESLLHT